VIIGDDKDSIEVFADYLQLFGVQVVSVGYNKNDALEIYKKYSPDLLFLEMCIKEDAIYALKQVRLFNPQTKVIVITADMYDETSELEQLKPVEIFFKPYDSDKIMDLLQKVAGIAKPIEKTKAALISVIVEQTLLEIGNSVAQKVGDRLYAKHGCYFSDCLAHPEYLKDVLQEIFGNASSAVIKKIKENLIEFEEQAPISQFLSIISK
jgi:two-component system chemotaxis response regulator CheY